MTTSIEPRPRPPQKVDEVASVVLVTTIASLALVYVLIPFTPVLVIWEVLAVLYLVLLFVRFKNRATRGASPGARALSGRLLEVLSWALPVAASFTGATSAITLLTTQGAASEGAGAFVIGALGSGGIVIAWLLLQTGFAEIYESMYERLPEPAMLSFPGVEDKPILSDFPYLAFTVGTSFAVSGVTIASRKVRRVILLHSVTSFFYNALLIAIAIQVVQRIIAGA